MDEEKTAHKNNRSVVAKTQLHVDLSRWPNSKSEKPYPFQWRNKGKDDRTENKTQPRYSIRYKELWERDKTLESKLNNAVVLNKSMEEKIAVFEKDAKKDEVVIKEKNQKIDAKKEKKLNIVKELSSNPRKTALKTFVLTLPR